MLQLQFVIQELKIFDSIIKNSDLIVGAVGIPKFIKKELDQKECHCDRCWLSS